MGRITGEKAERRNKYKLLVLVQWLAMLVTLENRIVSKLTGMMA